MISPPLWPPGGIRSALPRFFLRVELRKAEVDLVVFRLDFPAISEGDRRRDCQLEGDDLIRGGGCRNRRGVEDGLRVIPEISPDKLPRLGQERGGLASDRKALPGVRFHVIEELGRSAEFIPHLEHSLPSKGEVSHPARKVDFYGFHSALL